MKLNIKRAGNCFIVLGLMVVIWSCSFKTKRNGETNGRLVLSEDTVTLTDIPYGNDSLQKMDVYLMAGRTPQTPFVILIHGGGWGAGDKKDADFMVDNLIRNHINVANLNYRLGNLSTIHYQEIINDIDSALTFIVRHAEDWNIRKQNYVLWGGSAGANLALLYAYKYDRSNIVSAVITLGAPTKLNQIDDFQKRDIGLLQVISGKTWNGDSTDIAFKAPSPYYSSHFKPTLLIHGEADSIVFIHQSVVMSQLLNENIIDNIFFPLPNGGHGGEGISSETMGKLNETMMMWILKYSK